jgi:hypothetical protein
MRFATRDDALREAFVLIDKGHEVHTLAGPNNEEVSRKDIEAHFQRERKP